jgi:HEAT repeat protein
MQLDLFGGGGNASAQAPKSGRTHAIADPTTLSDREILAMIPDAGIPLVFSLIDEAGRRKLKEAVPVLDRLCRLFTGFGVEREVPEQAAALLALASIGGREAQAAMSGLLSGGVIQGPTLKIAARAAATLKCRLPAEIVLSFLSSSDPEMRATTCDLALPRSDIFAALLSLLADPDNNVRTSAACALGRHGRHEARDALKNLLRKAPTPAVVEAIAPIADPESIVLLGRLAKSGGSLAKVALDALSGIDDPLAMKISGALPEQADRPEA